MYINMCVFMCRERKKEKINKIYLSTQSKDKDVCIHICIYTITVGLHLHVYVLYKYVHFCLHI